MRSGPLALILALVLLPTLARASASNATRFGPPPAERALATELSPQAAPLLAAALSAAAVIVALLLLRPPKRAP